MHRTTPLTAATLLGLALLAATTSASAAGETCEGVAATIVGTPDTRVAGTPGDDVILSNGAFSVEAGEGDDLICVSAAADPRGHNTDVDAGPGDDVVVVVAASDECLRSRMRASGGAGDDRITGTINADVLRGGAGNDWLTGRRGKDVARGGPGRDTCFSERTSACER